MWEAGSANDGPARNWDGMKLPGTCAAAARHMNSSECLNDSADTLLANQTSTIMEMAETAVMSPFEFGERIEMS